MLVLKLMKICHWLQKFLANIFLLFSYFTMLFQMLQCQF